MDSPTSAYNEKYFLACCGGYEWFERFGARVLKPSLQSAVLAADLQPHHAILDVGAGRGELVAHLAERGFNVQGVDFSDVAVNLARKAFPSARFQLMDANRLSFAGQTFDRIFLLGTIEHLSDEETSHLLAQLKPLLRPGGRLIVTTCTNRLYYKTISYGLRRALAGAARRLGFSVALPSPPRTEEDEVVHVNEHHYFSLRRTFQAAGWAFAVTPMRNPKLEIDQLYAAELHSQIPLRPRPAGYARFHRAFVFRFPLSLLLARQYLAVLTPRF